jgi:hypothetical protein
MYKMLSESMIMPLLENKARFALQLLSCRKLGSSSSDNAMSDLYRTVT